MSSQAQAFPKQRRHTLLFLEQSHDYRPVAIDSEIVMDPIVTHRQANNKSLSYLAYFIQAVSQVVSHYPEANSLLTGRYFPRLLSLGEINAKFTLDKQMDGQRLVASAVIEQADQLSLQTIQQRIDYFKGQDFADCPEFAPIRKLHQLPLVLSRVLFGRAMQDPRVKSRVQGSFTITSLGGRAVNRFIPLPGCTLTLGVGDITQRAIVREGQMTVAWATTLTLVFDHRVIDGALAAEILSAIKQQLENFNLCPE